MSDDLPTSACNLPTARISSDGPRYRLAFAIHRYFPHGGLQRTLKRVATACADLGHEVQVLTTRWEGPRPSNLAIRPIRLSARTNHGCSREFADLVHRIVRQEQFDCLVGFNKMPGLDVYRCGDPCLAAHLQQTKLSFIRWLPRYRTYLKLEEGIFGNGSDADLLVLADSEKDRIMRHYGTAESRLHVLPAGIDRNRLNASGDDIRASVRNGLGLAEEDFVVLMVGSSFDTKGVDRAIFAIHSLPEPERSRAQLVIVGDGHAEPMKRLARRLKLADRVQFVGVREDIGGFYRAADVLLHPARQEAGGAAILESIVCGLPVVVTANCGYATHIERAGAGLVCPHPFDQDALNRLLAEACTAERRAGWRNNALAYSNSTDLYSMIERTVEVIIARAARNRQPVQLRRAA